ncbi:hypothetical protein OsccyDRAFT_1917 [Leptolyngbyaceae cyanobacterium JSC-12]|nr:hypothetical protein OsccyDRAFT_1917 [Leptolyngbyaceae cyanobacterium JSC-12]
MTVGGDFIPGDPAFDESPDYPVVFGLRLTPTVTGILLALLGLAGAGALLYYLVLPEWDTYQQLKTKVEQTELEIQQQQAIAQKIEAARKDLELAKQQRADVQTLFANESALDTLLLDLNRQVDARNADLARRREQKLAACPAIVQQNVEKFEQQFGSLATRAELKTFKPTEPKSSPGAVNPEIITDSSYGPQVNGKLKRKTVTVALVGNYEQTAAILQSIERLQPLLVIRNLTSETDARAKNFIPLPGTPGCIPDTSITTEFQLDALLPLSPADKAQVSPTQPAQPK